MKHFLILLALALPLGCQTGGGDGAQPADAEISAPGRFRSDSLGVAMTLPDSPGWSFRRDASVPGASYVTALHESQNASVRLYVHPRSSVEGIQEVIRRRRDQLAGVFQVKELDDVVEKVLQENSQEVGGFPAWQYQAVSQPVAFAAGEVSRILFLLIMRERPDHIFEAVGLLRVPLKPEPTPEQQAATQKLESDLTFLMGSIEW